MNTTVTTVEAYAHCVDALCEGNQQQPVTAEHKEVFHTFHDRDPSDKSPIGAYPENSHVYLEFADESDKACPVCGGPRNISEQVRPQYSALSGYRQDELLRRKRVNGPLPVPAVGTVIQAAKPDSDADRRIEELETIVAELSSRITAEAPAPDEDVLPTGVRRRGNRFQASWRDQSGKQYAETFATLDEAAAHRAKMLAAQE